MKLIFLAQAGNLTGTVCDAIHSPLKSGKSWDSERIAIMCLQSYWNLLWKDERERGSTYLGICPRPEIPDLYQPLIEHWNDQCRDCSFRELPPNIIKSRKETVDFFLSPDQSQGPDISQSPKGITLLCRNEQAKIPNNQQRNLWYRILSMEFFDTNFQRWPLAVDAP